MFRAGLKSLRAHQWVKNLFVLAPAVFAKRIFEPEIARQSFSAFALFCFVSSIVYIINDIRDLDADRLHPTKRNRPIASGALSISSAWRIVVVLGICALSVAFTLPVQASFVVAVYGLVNIIYSWGLKRVPYLDVLVIALGFVLRVFCGSAATGISITAYLLVTTFLLAAYLGFGKRLHELVQHEHAISQRAALAGYSLRVLRALFIGCGALTLIVYTLYVLSPETRAYFHTGWLALSLPFVIFGIVRFGTISLYKETPESPTEEMLRDPYFMANLVLWALTMAALVYVW